MTACTLTVSWSTTRYAHDSQSIVLLSSLCAENFEPVCLHPICQCCSCDTILKQGKNRMEGCYPREVSV